MDALEWLYDALWRLVDRLGRWVTAYKPELFCAVPLALIVGGGVYGTADTMQWDGLAVLIVLEVMVVIIANPFHCWDRLLPPRSRTLMAAGILIALMPFSFYGMMLEIALTLWALAVGLWVIALWRRRLWLGLYRVRQSPDVDKVLAHLSHDGDWQAGRAWEQYGCRETRALLHQAVEAECTEGEMYRTYMPCYLLGFLHGAAAETVKNSKAEDSREALKQQARQLEQQQAEIASLKADNTALSRKLAQAEHSADESWARAHVLEGRLEDVTLTPQQRDAAVLAYVNAGHSYTRRPENGMASAKAGPRQRTNERKKPQTRRMKRPCRAERKTYGIF